MKFLDQILLVIALVVTGASAAIFLGGEPPRPAPNVAPMGESRFEQLTPPLLTGRSPEWGDPRPAMANVPESVYHAFTPPIIFWNRETGQFEWKPFVAPEPPEPFGFVLRAVTQEPYRVQFQTAIRQDDGSNLLQFFLPNRGVNIQGRAGDSFPEHGFEIRAYELKREANPDGTLMVVPTAVIFDAEIQREVELTTLAVRVMAGQYRFTVATVEPNPARSYEWQGEPGEEIIVDATQRRYVLLSAEPEAERINVRKEFLDEEKEPEQQTLTPTPEVASAPTRARSSSQGSAPTDNSRPAPANSAFDQLFSPGR